MATALDTYPEPNSRRTRGFRERHPADAYFFPGLVAAIWAMMLAGFVPEVIARAAGNAPPYPLIIHVHAVVFFGWLVFLASQVTLIQTGNVRWHRKFGLVGLALALAIAVVGPAAALTMQMAHVARQPPQFLAVQFLNIATFLGLFSAGLALRRHPAAHKRLMMIATLALAGAGFGRIIRLVTGDAPPFTIIPGVYFGGDLLILSIAIYDWVTRGRLHPVFLPAAGASIAVQLVAGYLLHAPAWIMFTRGLVS